MQSNLRKRNNNKKRGKRRNTYEPRDNKIVTFARTIVPDAIRVRLIWYDSNTVFNNAGAGYVSKRFQPSSAYDLDPLIGGTAVPGFNEWAAFYKKYRVLSSKTIVTAANYDANTVVQLVMVPLHVDPGATPVLNTITSWLSQPFSRKAILSKSGGMDRATVALSLSHRDFVGSDTLLYDDSYSSNVTTNPVNNIFLAVGFYVIGGVATFTTGVATNITISIMCEFYERQEITS
jgi:hypothetical protein